ncbi:MAG: hypothetical protein IJ736_09805, partial [Firmicutes bacterium]|nr:hypothetical protein [Bacillota bacterium]
MSYIEKWGILTNIIHIKGGGKWFKNIMKHIEEIAPLAHDLEKWNSNLFQMKKSPYSPQRCCNYCQYCNECNHSKNILTTAIPSMHEINIIENKRNYVGIDTARNQLHEAMINALSDRDNSIHIIKAPTGLGKTQEYINCMKLSAKPFIIAVPTNKLKLEVFNRCINAGITDIVFTPEIPSEIGENNINKLKTFYTKGDIHGYSKFLKILESEYPCMLQYKKNLQMTLTSKGHIITTHIRLINDMFGDDILSSHEIIIDEDIIKNILVTTKIPKKSLKNIIFNGNTTLSELLKTYYIPANSVMSSVSLKPMKINEKIPPTEYSELVKTADINFNINDLLSADAAYISGDYIYYAVIRKIPDKKLIIMSATASDFVYKNLLKDRTIKLHNIGNVHYKGKVIQYHNKSYSRNYISSNTEIFDRVKRYHKGYNLITFLKYSSVTDELHFGNTEGKDTFDNKDLLIIGTPFQDEAVYKLLAVSMGFDCNEINKSRLNHRTVDVNEYKFTFFTYDYD